MEIKDFFDLSKPLKRVQISTFESKCVPRSDKENPYPEARQLEHSQDYAKEFQRIEEENFLANYNNIRENGTINTLNRLEEVSSAGLTDTALPHLTDVYDKFNFSKPPPNKLSINLCKDKILHTINTSQVTIIRGATGCGKTTQVPQFILDDHYEKRLNCNIIVTQPRKIAAISIARRVSKERDWPLGELVGYQVGLDAKTNADTRLQYVTTGVLLQRLVKEQSISKFTHVILDEVHERDQDMDFALLVIRKLLRTNSPYIKVILMSATFNTSKFSQYFSMPGINKLEPATVIDVPNENSFHVKIIYLDDMKNIGYVSEEYSEPYIDPQLLSVTRKLIEAFDQVEKVDYENSIAANSTNNTITPSIGSVLVFLPGIYEIEMFYTELTKQAKKLKHKWHILPLHSSITCEEQQCVFRAAPAEHRKIILSTNIAESSITVTDVKFVIDFCLSKELVTAPGSNFGMLKLIWASKANCNQRAGRVGRVADGRVYRMVPKEWYQSLFINDSKPEMIRAPLSKLVLFSKQLNMGSPDRVLALAMDPPDLHSIGKTILHLKEIGGLLVTCNGKVTKLDGDMTLLGHVMAALPVDVHISKLIMLGYLFGCLDECIIMGAALSLKSVFSNPFNERLKSYDSKLTWADGCMSDPIAFLNAYRVWKHSRQQNYFSRSEGAEAAWAKRFYLQAKVMNEIAALELDIQRRLQRMKICPLSGIHKVKWSDGEKKLLYKTVIAGAFYPNYFLRSSSVDETHALKVLGGRNPYNTVYFSGMDLKQPGDLYVDQLKKALSDCSDDTKIEFDHSSKIYAVFPSSADQMHYNKELQLMSSIPGKISIAVYKAIKMRHLQLNPVLRVLKNVRSSDVAEEQGIQKAYVPIWETVNTGLKSSLPSVTVKFVSFKICHFINCGCFWVHPLENIPILKEIKEALNANKGEHLRTFDNSLKPYVGQICAALYEEEYYRVRVIEAGYYKGEFFYKVFFLDYGNTVLAELKELKAFGGLNNKMLSYPMLAYEVTLAEVQPSEITGVGNGWLAKANDRFAELTTNKDLRGKVISVVKGVVSCYVYLGTIDMNQWLIDLAYGQHCEESFQSKANYELRSFVETLTPEQIAVYDQEQEAPVEVNDYVQVQHPNVIDCKFTITLNGPHSPLEAQIYPLLNATKEHLAQMDPQSVNSVLLSPTPHYGSELLIVAAEVSESHRNRTNTLRNTTIMPNIVGMPALMAMLYCPSMKLFVNETWSKYTKILCGLGCDEEGIPYFKEHDMELDINFVLDNEDIKLVNKIRLYMGRLLSFPPNVLETPSLLTSHLKVGNVTQNYLKSLWMKNRLIIDNSNRSNEVTSWKLSSEYKNNMLTLRMLDDPYSQIYTIHKILKIKTPQSQNPRELIEHDLQLKEISNQTILMDDVECRICEVILRSIMQLRLHILSKTHTETLAKLSTKKHG